MTHLSFVWAALQASCQRYPHSVPKIWDQFTIRDRLSRDESNRDARIRPTAGYEKCLFWLRKHAGLSRGRESASGFSSPDPVGTVALFESCEPIVAWSTAFVARLRCVSLECTRTSDRAWQSLEEQIPKRTNDSCLSQGLASPGPRESAIDLVGSVERALHVLQETNSCIPRKRPARSHRRGRAKYVFMHVRTVIKKRNAVRIGVAF